MFLKAIWERCHSVVAAWRAGGSGGVGVGMGDGEGRVKATVMMKHFQFNESGGNQEEMGFCAFAVYCSLLRRPAASLRLSRGGAACKPLPPTNLSFSSPEEKPQPPPCGGVQPATRSKPDL